MDNTMKPKEVALRKCMDEAIRHLQLAEDVVDGSDLIGDCINEIEKATETLARFIQREELVNN